MPTPLWKNIEHEDVTTEGYIITDAEYSRYATPSPLVLFEDEESAWRVLRRLETDGKIKPGTHKPVRARLAHKREVEVIIEPRLKLVVSK